MMHTSSVMLIDESWITCTIGSESPCAVGITSIYVDNRLMDENGFAAEDVAQAYNKNCVNRHVILFL